MNIPLPSEIYSLAVQATAALVVLATVQYGMARISGRSEGRVSVPLFLLGWVVAGIAAGATWFGVNILTSRYFVPEIAIVSPENGDL